MKDQYQDLTASYLFCAKCRQATPVREKILLYLPGKTLYDYICTRCGNSVGKREKPNPDAMRINIAPMTKR